MNSSDSYIGQINMDHLPPLLKGMSNDSVIWQKIENINYEEIGFFLSCHLVVEHYVDEYLKVSNVFLAWDEARLSFDQKIKLLSRLDISEKYSLTIPAIKKLNSLRNKFSHNIEFEIKPEDLLPLKQYLTKVSDGDRELPTESREILHIFTLMTCAYLAGLITGEINKMIEESESKGAG